MILTNPPFGRRQSIQVFTGDGEAETEREDYQRVRVTGLNKAVWPDPPSYHERKQREEENALKAKSAERQRPRPHRRTEDGTKDSK